MSGVTDQLRRRIRIALASVLVLVVAGMLAAVTLLQTVKAAHSEVVFDAADRFALAEGLQIALHQRVGEARGYLLAGDAEFLTRRDLAKRAFEDRLHRLEADAGPSTLLPAIHALAQAHDHASGRALALRARDQPAAVQVWEDEVRGAQQAVAAAIERLIVEERARFGAARAASLARGAQAVRWMIATGALVALIVLLLFVVFVRTARELGAQLRAEQRQEMFQLLEQVPVGIFVVTADGEPYYANEHARSLLGRDLVRDARPGVLSEVYAAYEIGSDRLYPMERAPITRALAGERSEISDMEIRRGDQVIPLHVRGAPVEIRGELAFGVAAFQDVRELRRISTRDALTGLPNRSAITEAFLRERLLAERLGYSLVVAIIDLDRFKAINDTHGHAMGDEVLRRCAKLLAGSFRRSDLVARWGGEELVVAFPGTDVDGARLVVEKALVAVRAEAYATTAGETFHVTFSAGVAQVGPGETLETAIARADVHLYAAKHAGRNRVSTGAAAASNLPALTR
ncbi:MAG: diguanylate cyclase [Deltaproteobacteria bacterium]|nr:diguanylate cyclase [Deltaproteobacteria bacterium]